MTIFAKTIQHSSPDHDRAFQMRNRLIYKPWRLDLGPQDHYADIGCRMLGLYRDQDLIGCIQSRQEGRDLLIKDLAIEAKFRNRGLAKGLLSLVESQLDDQDLETIQVLSPLGRAGFFLASGYKAIDKTQARNQTLVLHMAKAYEDRAKRSSLALYQEAQDKPLGIFSTGREGHPLLAQVRLRLPREDIFYIEVPDLSDYWIAFVEDLMEGTFKYHILSPSLGSAIGPDRDQTLYTGLDAQGQAESLFPQIQDQLAQENLLKISQSRGQVRLYSYDPQGLSQALAQVLPTEKRLEVKTIYEK